MIAAPSTIAQTAAAGWKQQWRESVRDAGQLLALLGLQAQAGALGVDPDNPFPLRVPRAFVARMRPGDPRDPLLLQVLATGAERQQVGGFVADPVGDLAARRSAGVLHKYQGRALLVLTGSCAVHCRYCFRRHFPYSEESVSPAQLDAAIDYLASQDDIEEVLLSGGDPLSLDTPRLRLIGERLRRLPRLRRLRIHTRLPVVLPARIDPALLAWLEELPWPLTLVIHANHANELDAEVQQALQALRPRTHALLNQAVLLRGVNDQVLPLRQLSERLFELGVLPYYLNLLDPVQGAAHFDVDAATGQALIEQLRIQLPGYLVPRLVREVAGAAYKVPLA